MDLHICQSSPLLIVSETSASKVVGDEEKVSTRGRDFETVRRYSKTDIANRQEAVDNGFREFRPYLKKRLAYIQSTGREYELQDEIEDIQFYLELMNDILVDESHGVEQLKGYIDKIHEMIRKNPMTDVSGRRLSSLEEDEYNDDDRPRSPSPGARGLDSVTDNIPLIPTHGAHRTVDVRFSPENDHSSEPMSAVDAWGKSRHSNAFFAPDSYNKDVDMRGNYCGTGRGQRRWSEENTFAGTGGSGRGSWGVGRGSGMPGMNDLDIRPGRGRGRGVGCGDVRNDRNRPDWYHAPAFAESRVREARMEREQREQREREREFKMPSWLVEDDPTPPPNNGNPFGDWQQNTDSFQEPSWMRNPSRNHNSNENREYDDRLSDKEFAQYFERRPSSESRRSDRSEEYLSDHRPRNERGFEPALNRPELNRSPVDCPRGPVHGDIHGRVPSDDDRHVRSRVDASSPYQQQGTPPGPNPMSSVGNTHQQGYGVPQQQPHYPNHGAGLLPSPPPYGGSPPLLQHPPHAPGGMHMSNARQPMMPDTGRPMGYKPRTMNNTSFMRPPGGGYHIPPPSFTPTRPLHSATQKPPQSHPFHETSAPQRYASPMEPIDRVREISSMKAKQCFGRQMTRPPTSTPTGQPSPGASTSTSVASGQLSPNTTNNEPQSSAIDPCADRLGRMAGYCPVQSRQQSPPTAPKPRSNTTSVSDAGNVLRQSSSSDPRIRQRVDPERRKLDEARDRVIYHDSMQKQSHKPSKLAQFRKQLEKEGLHRLGRQHQPKKQSGSFEDAIASCDTNLESSGKSERIKSPTSSQSKERAVGAGRESRSHSEKTETSNSSKKSSHSHKSKERKWSGSKSVDAGGDRRRSKDSTDRSSPKRSQRKLDDKEKPNDKPVSSDSSNKSSKTTIQPQTGVEKRGDDVALSKFKIPRKPKPVEAQKPPVTQKEATPPQSPESPEPALTQVPDSDTRVEDNETPSTSTKSSVAIKTTTPNKSDVNPDALEMLKQFLVTTSSDPSDVQSILQNPDALKNVFFKIQSEISAAKEKSGEMNSTETATVADTDTEVEAEEKSQAPEEPDEEVQERGRSREKKRNTKRRSSLEKLHDALKEMRFDTMLPLGPRRCTRGGQEESSAEGGTESSETTDKLETAPEVAETSLVVENTEGFARRQVSKKRGRPPKEPKAKKRVKKVQPQSTEVEESVEEEVEASSSAPVATTSAAAARKGKKKKVKGTKVTKRKRGKKAGPVTRAQSALKKVVLKKFAKVKDDEDEATTQENEEKSRKTTGRILRRLTRRQVGQHDSAVNTNLCKVKVEAHKTVSLKQEQADPDPFMESTNNIDDDLLADQLANIINDNLDTVANMDGQTEDSMDLDIFNTLDDVHDGEDASFDVTNPSNSTSSDIDKPVDPASTPSTSSVTTETSVTTTTTTTAEVEEGNNAPLISISTSIEGVVAKQPDTSPVENTPTSPPSVSTNPKVEANHSQEEMVEMDTSSEDLSLTTFSSENQENEISSRNISSISSNVPDVSNIHPEPVALPLATESAESEKTNPKAESMDLSELKKDVFKCDKCSFSGKKIIPHYVNKHSSCNIPQARLMPTTFDGLIELNISQSPQLLEIPLEQMFPTAWPCLYCENKYGCIVDFYEHLTSHTGEFRYVCGECGIAYPFQKSIMNHMKQHKGVKGSKAQIRLMYELSFDKKSTELSGFLCNDCYYFQLRFENIIHHIEETLHSSSDVKSIRFTRNSIISASVPDSGIDSTAEPPSSITSNASEECSNQVPTIPESVNSEQSIKEPEPDKILTEAENEEPPVISLQNQETQLVDESEIQCVFFGTDSNFTPPPINLNECTLPIQPVFEATFLDSLLRRVYNANESEFDGSSFCDVTSSRKRKRDKSADETLDSSSHNGDATGANPEAAGDGDNPSPKPPPKRTCNIRTTYSTRRKWNNAVEDYIEPNNFFESGDELSDESDSTDSDDAEEKFDSFKKIKTEISEDLIGMHILRNNENIIKTRSLIKDDCYDKMYKENGKLRIIRRPGDLYAPNTVIFGYIKPPTGKSTPKLRDEKEADKLGGIAGRRMFPMKEELVYTRMITKEKLTHLFKCMATYCSYTTDDPYEFLHHLTAKHFKPRHMQQSCSRLMSLSDVKLLKDADACSYCSARLKDAKELVDHVVNQHGRSIYQCSKCFFRSYYHRYVVRHMGIEHSSDNCSIIKCSKRMEIQYNEATLFQIFVYKCDLDNPSCDKGRRFVFREDFLDHIKACVPSKDLYPCHLCKEKVALEDLIEHYKTHNLFKFHCSYCQFGSEVKTDLDEHFVNVHPNTSGRVFYRVKPSDTNQPGSIVHRTNNAKPTSAPASPCKKGSQKSTESSNTPSESIDNSSEKDSSDGGHSVIDGSGVDNGDFDDNEKGRVTGLKGEDLYRCVTGECTFVCHTGDAFKDHVTTCSQVAESRSLSCAHCERKMKTPINLLEHLKGHGEKKLLCSLCPFRCWTITEITKHLKTVHRVLYHKLVRKESGDTDPDVLAIPKEVASKSSCDLDTFANNYYSLARKAVYSFENIEKLPLSKIFSSELHCAMCPFATKVRSNMVRHLTIHKQALEDGKTIVPQAPRINPVPYLSREGLEFDKMMNLAASSHKTDGGSATADVVKRLPQFVKEQFRYVCSVCEHITSDDALLQTHIKVIHSEVTAYKCPHCQTNPETKDNPDYTVPLDKISHHLRLHGPKLYKCGHCMVVHQQLRPMEKHIPEKHPEKKPIHYLIRDVDPDGVPSARATTSGANRRQSVEDPKSASSEKWKCFLCSSKTIFGSWEETKSHCEAIHKFNSQFMCAVCNFSSDDVTEMLTHCRENCKSEDKSQILVMFSKCESLETEESSIPMWKRGVGAVRHIRGNFTEDSAILIRYYSNNTQQPNDQLPSAATSPLRGTSNNATMPTKSSIKPPTSSAKPRRSGGGTQLQKTGTTKLPVNLPAPTPTTTTTPPKLDFKYCCNKCDMYKTKNPNELRVHLSNELRYKRWECLLCNTTFTTEKSLRGHIERDHQRTYSPELFVLRPENQEMEAEINNCIEKQSRRKDMINSFSVEKMGQLACKTCNEEGFTYETFETHILQKHSR